jgi:hypothetical protein
MAAAEAIADFSASANIGQERRISASAIVGIVVGVVASLAVAVIAIAYFVFASWRRAQESAVFPELEMSDFSISERTFVSENASSGSGKGIWSDEPDEGDLSA